MKILVHLLWIGLLFSPGFDVTTRTITWSSSKITQLTTGTIQTDPATLVVHQKEKIEWIDGRGNKKYDLTIKSTKGNLQTDQSGEIIYLVTGQNIGGNVTIKTGGSETIIKIVLVENTKPLIYEWVVKEYTIQ